jgi:hypothetical protein
VAALREGLDHWRAVSDDAAIAMRSWDTLTSHGQLVGQYSQEAVNTVHGVYDTGPLQYWLLAIPVHIDPHFGVFWGAALWCVVAAMIVVEAVRSVMGPLGGLVAAAIVVANVAWMPKIPLDPAWNPYFGEMFFLAAIATTWAVLCGKRRWLPVAVLSASVATQAHLMFALPCITLAVLALVWAAVEARRARRSQVWLLGALCVGLGCWIAPLIQELTTHPGNLTLLLRSERGQLRTGPGFGVRFLAAATFPHPIWWTPSQGLHLRPILDAIPIAGVVGVLVAGFTALIAVVAFRVHQRQLGALAVVSFIVSLALTATFANIPDIKLVTLAYLIIVAFPAGALAWVTLGWAAVVTEIRIWKPALTTGGSRLHRRRGSAAGFVTAILVGGTLALSVLAQTQQAEVLPVYPLWSSMKSVQVAAGLIEKVHPKGTYEIRVNTAKGGLTTYEDALGLAWTLKAAGWSPLVAPVIARVAGPDYGFRPGTPIIVVDISPSGVTVSGTGSQPLS